MATRGKPIRICTRCGRERLHFCKGLCKSCYDAEARRRWRAGRTQPWHEPTMEELEQVIAEQMANKPDWWDSETARIGR